MSNEVNKQGELADEELENVTGGVYANAYNDYRGDGVCIVWSDGEKMNDIWAQLNRQDIAAKLNEWNVISIADLKEKIKRLAGEYYAPLRFRYVARHDGRVIVFKNGTIDERSGY